MSYSGDSDPESVHEANVQQYKCHVCNYRPNMSELIEILEQIVALGPYLIALPNGQYFVRCLFEDCCRYYHLHCIHPSFPDEALNFDHLYELQENGIHCPKCEPGVNNVNY